MNIFGRISLAVFVLVVAEAIEIKVSSCSRGIFSRINVPGSRTKFRNILSFISVLLWILVSAINLNIIDSLVNLLQQLLLKPRTLGNMESDLDLVKKLVTETIKGAEEIVKNVPRQILFNSIGFDNAELKVLVWVKSVYVEASFRSYVLEQLYRKFKEHNIKVMQSESIYSPSPFDNIVCFKEVSRPNIT